MRQAVSTSMASTPLGLEDCPKELDLKIAPLHISIGYKGAHRHLNQSHTVSSFATFL